MPDEQRAGVADMVKFLTEGAARISTGDGPLSPNGLPLATFTALATHILDHLQGYRDNYSKKGDTDYLARQLQSVFENLQDYQGEIP